MSVVEREDLFENALKVLVRYKLTVLSKLQEEELEIDPGGPLHGVTPSVLRSYRDALWKIQVAESALRNGLEIIWKTREPDTGSFRCFRCRIRIKQSEDACPICGWTWRASSA